MSVRRTYDTVLIATVAVLLVIGLVMVQSASGPVAADRMGDSWHYVRRQALAMGLGIGGCVALALIPYHFIRRWAWVLFGLVAVALCAVFAFDPVNGARRWIGFGGINFQPSEFAKVAAVLCMADFLDRHADRLADWKVLAKACAIPGVLMVLVLAEPDFGTTCILGGMAFLTLYVAGLRRKVLWGLGVGGVLAAIPAVMFASYRMDRFRAVLDPYADPAGAGYQIIQSLIAFHSGGLVGRGLGESQAKHLFLPEPWTDFIASVLAEELGLIGILALIGLYGVLIWRGLRIARNAGDLFGVLLATSVTGTLGLQAFFNLGVALGIVPPKGLVLPFMSYGASAIMGHLLCIGLLLNISANGAPVPKTPPIYRATATAEGF
ncbi:MAG TPA: putative lipid II flippase FtsW [Myxococcota bacterium]|nr:putative lipid II flippase FtsW [Myxococcota bacterium]